MAKKQTAGRDRLGEFAPKFAQLNDDVLFREVWSREKELSPKMRSMITIAALLYGGNFERLDSRLKLGKEHGITKKEISEMINHFALFTPDSPKHGMLLAWQKKFMKTDF